MSMIPDELPSTPPPAKGSVVGHNQPPGPVETLVAEQREALTEEIRERLAYIVGRADQKTVVDRETAGQAGDIIKVADEFMDLIETGRVARTRPYREAADRAKGVVDEFLEPLREAKERLRGRLKAWDREEDERIKAQQAEQEAFFAKGDTTLGVQSVSPPPAMKPAKRRKIVGDLGARVTQVDVKHYRVVDVRAVPDIILESETVKAAIVSVAKSMAKHMPTISGIEITTETDNRVQ